MSAFVSSSKTDFQPDGCVICGEECGYGVLCRAHQGINALAAWVDEGLIGDWDRDVGSEQLNHRTMLVQPPVGSASPALTPTPTAAPAPASMGWRNQLAVIVRRFGYWVGLDDDDDGAPPDPWGC